MDQMDIHEQRAAMLYIENRASFLTEAMKAINPTAAYPVELIETAVKEFRQRLSM
jgi:hypothetical protein